LGLAVFLAVLAFAAIAGGSASDEAVKDSVDARVNRIVNGLLPAAIIKGQPLPLMTLAERMKYYGVPEVSIAFFDPARSPGHAATALQIGWQTSPLHRIPYSRLLPTANQ
jgi:hypothetical protein